VSIRLSKKARELRTALALSAALTVVCFTAATLAARYFAGL